MLTFQAPQDSPLERAPPPPLTAPLPRVLLVDDNNLVRLSLDLVLKRNGFEVRTAANVNEALHLIGSESFDLLLSDLHMPAPGDGLTVVSAMRHSNPKTVTLIFSAHPAMQQAAQAILRQADNILVKPMAAEALVKTLHAHLGTGAVASRPIEDIPHILEAESQATIQEWIHAVRREPHLKHIQLEDDALAGYLPQMFRDLVSRLLHPHALGSSARPSAAAAAHGLLRHRQGYTAAMLVDEARILQVCIFKMLQDNLARIDFSLLLVGVMAIADEVQSQLAQSMATYCTGAETKPSA